MKILMLVCWLGTLQIYCLVLEIFNASVLVGYIADTSVLRLSSTNF